MVELIRNPSVQPPAASIPAGIQKIQEEIQKNQEEIQENLEKNPKNTKKKSKEIHKEIQIGAARGANKKSISPTELLQVLHLRF